MVGRHRVGFQVAEAVLRVNGSHLGGGGFQQQCQRLPVGRNTLVVRRPARRGRARGGSFDPDLRVDDDSFVEVENIPGDDDWEEDGPVVPELVRGEVDVPAMTGFREEDSAFPVTAGLPDDGDLLYSESLREHADKRADGTLIKQDLPTEWVDQFACSVKSEIFPEIRNLYSRVGILVDLNFDDFVAVGADDSYLSGVSLQELSLSKARQVYLETGMPSIVESTQFEIFEGDKVLYTLRAWKLDDDLIEKRIQETQDSIGISKVPGTSGRRASFESTAAYSDGENDFVTEGSVEMDMMFATPAKAAIARSTALDNLYRELTRQLSFDLGHFENFGQKSRSNPQDQQTLVGGAMLRDRILRDGKVLRDGILKVSSFLNHQVDTELMDLCGVELAERLRDTMPNKVLTVEATGLIPALSVGRRLEIPVVFARKTRPLTISDSFQTTYRSATKGTMSELIVSTEYLTSSDRVLIIDDFLAGGSTAEALCKLCGMSRAKVVGVGVLIEKSVGGGRASLSGYDLPVVSLVRINSLEEGRIEIAETEPFTITD